METDHHTIEDLPRLIHSSGIKVSAHRIAVLEFISNSKAHPTVEEIYNALKPSYPAMSLTTVYNSLRALVGCGLVRQLEIESGVMRYDLGHQHRHGHFLCRGCGKVYDIPFPPDFMSDLDPGFKVDTMEWNCKGLCPACRGANEHTQL